MHFQQDREKTKSLVRPPFLQTEWNDAAILSAQAMMLGIYPPGKNNYKITEDQKYHAVPPIEGFDFKPWIDEMGLEDEIPLDDFDFDEEEKTDRSKEEPDWGNDWSDWSGDAEDYTG